MIIAYNSPNGLNLVRHLEDSGLSIQELVEIVVPQGVQFAIVGDYDLPEDDTYMEAWVLDMTNPAAPEILVDETKKAAIDRRIALKELDKWFADITAAGFVTAGGWKLGLTQQDITLLTGYYVLAKESAALGGDVPPLIDVDGVPHAIDEIEELTAIMLGYGQRRAEISQEYATRKAEILGA